MSLVYYYLAYLTTQCIQTFCNVCFNKIFLKKDIFYVTKRFVQYCVIDIVTEIQTYS